MTSPNSKVSGARGHELYIGLMSGTSADALDAALVDFTQTIPIVVGTHTLKVSKENRELIHQLAISGTNEILKLKQLDKDIALLSCTAIKQLCEQTDTPMQAVKAIGSHGQTLRHYPQSSDNTGYSLQVGDPNIIAENTGITTIADFRRRDIAAGGHGAPLTPAFHKAFFSSSKTTRVILNLGGIANITYLDKSGYTIGYDTGPANGLMDSWCQQHQQRPYDEGGKWAKSGKVIPQLLLQLLQHPYFSQTTPKSTGREIFNIPWLTRELDHMKQRLNPEDVQATLLKLSSESISLAIAAQDKDALAEVYVCGGGIHNDELITSLSQRLAPRKLSSTGRLGVDPDWVEAIAFAWLAKQTINQTTGNLPSVTGANREVILGGIYLA